MSNLAGADLASTYLSFYCSGMTDPVIDKLKVTHSAARARLCH